AADALVPREPRASARDGRCGGGARPAGLLVGRCGHDRPRRPRPARRLVRTDGAVLASVVVNNHNYERFVGEAVESALAQTYPHTEVVVVDDGSTDGSRDVLERFRGDIQLVLKPNGGQRSAFNAGLERSSGDLVCFLDADDTL